MASPDPPTDADEEEQERRFWEWLPKQGPREWHQMAMDWNWDPGIEPLEWVIRQEGCDFGTALLIYVLADPLYYEAFDSLENQQKENPYADPSLLIEICERCADGQYANYEFSPTCHSSNGRSYDYGYRSFKAEVGARVFWSVPDRIRNSLPMGESVDTTNFWEGYPKDIIPQRIIEWTEHFWAHEHSAGSKYLLGIVEASERQNANDKTILRKLADFRALVGLKPRGRN